MSIRYTMCDGIAFFEDSVPNARTLGPVSAEIGGVFASAQTRTLDDVKRLLAREAKAKRGNAVVGFRYGQKSVGLLRSLASRDDVNWYGSGTAAVVDPSDVS